MKDCNKCGETKRLDQFHKNAASKDGLKTMCSACHNADGRRRYKNNPEPDILRAQKWAAANTGRVRENNRQYHLNNAKKKCDAWRQWRNANPERARLKYHIRRAKQLNNGIFAISVDEIKRMLGRVCYLCRIAPSTQIDHILPVSRGGQHSVGNLLGACGPCNRHKSGMLLVEYRRFQKICAANKLYGSLSETGVYSGVVYSRVDKPKTDEE